MPNRTSTSSTSTSLVSLPRFLAAPGQCRSALFAGSASASWDLLGPPAPADQAVQRETISNLCESMLWLRSWWEAHQDAVRDMDGKAAAAIHDHFVDGGILARTAARQQGIELDEQRIRNYRWGASAQTLRMIMSLPATDDRSPA